MKKQLEDGIKLIGEIIAAMPKPITYTSERETRLLSLLGTLQGLLILETIKP